ncbi:TetR-like C-terminal domain-containing protein [Stenotrophomonas sp. 24(2023)]|uniref:TetR-like C-terminal domain-containing protein n=1 Tax=Stenotrophomonas sp. 24(2023) TaxID=3068324 RepID=UPI0027E0218E|nr:TetR-like C-terminal domain-containing protein [Stenotrophomonas sp. 24(2023)]WMJ68959.1 TetR-like C-terminal domain-containing protein [Stenotrophomonas sp. 24(2023)]
MARAGLTPDTLALAAAETADALGFEALTAAAVARRLGVRLPSLYSHVANLDELKGRVALLALQELADRVDEALAGRAGRDALHALADVHRAYARAYPGRFAAARHPLSSQLAAASAGPRLSRAMFALLRGYAIGEAEQVHAVRLLGSFLLGFALLEGADAFSHRAPASDASWERSLQVLDALLRQWPAAVVPA